MRSTNQEIGQRDKLFNLVEAQALLPLVQVITERHRTELMPVKQKLEKMLANDPRRAPFEREFEQIVTRWRGKIELLGATVPGLWVVEFNVGEGWLSWRYPELSLSSFRVAGATLSERQNLARYIEETDPDWAC
ncbi:hypothetical protein GCM10008090_16260 [Arenicella chitinivorans]|uniref:DUF2203 family protein n=1 Tax=Arenicella chitinivorans TaxID=1329800 RepID=A0A918RQ75_9GAMM|nr:DUF2203 family protein [Arenicella chitinivorans]GHA07211.1 hypothetical protein GCM10008090_16260 [Arenicella chitinivorans]